jgi:hypothetical protein
MLVMMPRIPIPLEPTEMKQSMARIRFCEVGFTNSTRPMFGVGVTVGSGVKVANTGTGSCVDVAVTTIYGKELVGTGIGAAGVAAAGVGLEVGV